MTSPKLEAIFYNRLLKECIPLIEVAASKGSVTIDNHHNGNDDHQL